MAKWFLNSAFVTLNSGGIVHAYPGARFITATLVGDDRELVTFLDQHHRSLMLAMVMSQPTSSPERGRN